jgi:hypothetical protein
MANGGPMSEMGQVKIANWIQFVLLLMAILAHAVYTEGRIAKMEQRLEDDKEARSQLMKQLDRIEGKVDLWQSTPNPSRKAQ